MERHIVVNQKQYKLPAHIDTPAYLDYCDVQDQLDSTKNYRRAEVVAMADAICKVYGDQFTLEDVMAPQYGLDPAQILTEFSMLEALVMERVNKRIEEIRENFTQGA